jgi:hypothetical protein
MAAFDVIAEVAAAAQLLVVEYAICNSELRVSADCSRTTLTIRPLLASLLPVRDI